MMLFFICFILKVSETNSLLLSRVKTSDSKYVRVECSIFGGKNVVQSQSNYTIVM